MRPLAISPENQQRLAILVPIIALLLSLFVVYPTWGRYAALQETVKKEQRELDELRSAPTPDVGKQTPASPGLPSEPPEFHGQIQLLVQLSGCRIKNFDLGGTAKQEQGPVRAVRARYDLEGRFGQIRSFLAYLATAPRLYVATDCTVTAKTKSIQPGVVRPEDGPPGTLLATLEIERYVTKPNP